MESNLKHDRRMCIIQLVFFFAVSIAMTALLAPNVKYVLDSHWIFWAGDVAMSLVWIYASVQCILEAPKGGSDSSVFWTAWIAFMFNLIWIGGWLYAR